MKILASLAATLCASFANAAPILIDDFSQGLPKSAYNGADASVTPGAMLGGYRYNEAYGGLTPITTGGVQTGYSWRDRGSNTGNSWGLASLNGHVTELNLNFGHSGYIEVNFLDVSPGLQLWAAVATYISGSGYGISTTAWESPRYTLSAGAQTDRLYLSDFLPGTGGTPMNYGDIDLIKVWITQPAGVYPPLGSPAYVLDSVYAVASEGNGNTSPAPANTVPEPASIALVLSGICAIRAGRRNRNCSEGRS